MSDTLLISLVVFIPTLVAVLLLFVPSRSEELIKRISLGATVLTFLATIELLVMYQYHNVSASSLVERAVERGLIDQNSPIRPGGDPAADWDLVFRYPWIKVFNVEYYMGVDGISLPLVLLTSLIGMLAMLASWNINKQIKGYCILFLLLETGMLGTFLALDFFLFYVFWEVMLLPMYFLIGVWGAPSRVEPDGRVRGGPYAAIKFFIYTLIGSVLMLLAMLAFYFGTEPHTFDIMKLHQEGSSHGWAAAFGENARTFQLIMFGLLFVGFAIKVPLFPFHTWLPDAHVEAPTPVSMILAGVLLKMGGYGFIRIAYPVCPEVAMLLAWPLAIIGVWNIIYGALAAMAQTDFKKLVAYSSISHMGYVVLGFAVWSLQERGLDATIWSVGVNGAMFQMIAHGISSAGMFFMVGVIYDRVHHRDLNRFGGLASAMPVYAGLSAAIFFAGLGLPGMCGFIGEVMTVLASWQFSKILAAIAAGGVILTAGYILWTLQRVFLGVPVEPGAGRELADINKREMVCAVTLVALAVILGVYPQLLFSFMEPSVTALVDTLHGTAKDSTEAVAGLLRSSLTGSGL